MHAWVEEMLLGASGHALELPPFEELEGTEETDVTNVFQDMMDRFIAEKHAEGHITGRRDQLVSMAERRFGVAAGRQLADALDGRPSARQLLESGDLILSCRTQEEFVGRLPH